MLTAVRQLRFIMVFKKCTISAVTGSASPTVKEIIRSNQTFIDKSLSKIIYVKWLYLLSYPDLTIVDLVVYAARYSGGPERTIYRPTRYPNENTVPKVELVNPGEYRLNLFIDLQALFDCYKECGKIVNWASNRVVLRKLRRGVTELSLTPKLSADVVAGLYSGNLVKLTGYDDDSDPVLVCEVSDYDFNPFHVKIVKRVLNRMDKFLPLVRRTTSWRMVLCQWTIMGLYFETCFSYCNYVGPCFTIVAVSLTDNKVEIIWKSVLHIRDWWGEDDFVIFERTRQGLKVIECSTQVFGHDS